VANGFRMTYRFNMEPWDELSGELAIDLANTLRLGRDGGTGDLLADPDRLARWLRRRGAPAGLGAPALTSLRGEVRALLAARTQGRRRLPRSAVAAVNRAVAAAPAVAQLEGGELVYRYHASPPDAFLADVAASAVMLVGGPGRDLLRRCAAPGCGRFFVASRPRQTWCGPSCGNRARLARFHRRRRAA
jgi:predicted RNA-binding Zn ribbon-like protein